MPPGRLTEYTPELAQEICERLAAGESLRKICAPDEMPAASTVCLWTLENRDGFAERYTRARQLQAELLADELFEIADDSTADYNHTRIRVDTRKWYLSKVLSKVYGDKTVLTGADGGPIVFAAKSILEESK